MILQCSFIVSVYMYQWRTEVCIRRGKSAYSLIQIYAYVGWPTRLSSVVRKTSLTVIQTNVKSAFLSRASASSLRSVLHPRSSNCLFSLRFTAAPHQDYRFLSGQITAPSGYSGHLNHVAVCVWPRWLQNQVCSCVSFLFLVGCGYELACVLCVTRSCPTSSPLIHCKHFSSDQQLMDLQTLK